MPSLMPALKASCGYLCYGGPVVAFVGKFLSLIFESVRQWRLITKITSSHCRGFLRMTMISPRWIVLMRLRSQPTRKLTHCRRNREREIWYKCCMTERYVDYIRMYICTYDPKSSLLINVHPNSNSAQDFSQVNHGRAKNRNFLTTKCQIG